MPTNPEEKTKKPRVSRVRSFVVRNAGSDQAVKPFEGAVVKEVGGRPAWAVTVKNLDDLIALAEKAGGITIVPAREGQELATIIVGSPDNPAN